MKLKFNGAAREVGRSCIEVNGKYLLDCGIKVDKHEVDEFHQIDSEEFYCDLGYPSSLEFQNIKAVFLSHGHLDHCGSLPLFNRLGMNCPIYCTKGTKRTAEILLNDSLKIHKIKDELVYYAENVNVTLMNMKEVLFGQTNKFNDVLFTFNDAGHIPGSSTILLTIDGKSLLYSGDINNANSNLMRAAHPIPKADVLITETTYGGRDHPDKIKEEKRFLDSIKKVLERGGSVIIPVFAVGRAAEVLMILDKGKFEIPIYIDGMAKNICEKYLKEDLRDIEKYKSAFEKVIPLGNFDRWHSMDNQGIFVATSGMCTGGPVLDYIKVLSKKARNAIFFTGYLGEGTNGRSIIENRTANIDGKNVEIKCGVDKFDFSAHSGKKELMEFIKKVGAKDIIFVHGDYESMRSLCDSLGDDYRVHIPENGDEIEIE